MVVRHFWLKRIEDAWKRRSVIWLMGVRRSGKTMLCRGIPNSAYFDCELPSVRRRLDDPEAFLAERKEKVLILDEIHRLDNPSEILKIAADHFPKLRVIATGSSSLGASSKFRDTLAGRKVDIHLTPMNCADFEDFGLGGIKQRLRNGGLPPLCLADRFPEGDFQEWMDAYWAKDIQELFRLERRHSYQRFMELLFLQAGGIFEATSFAGPCGVSRSTIQNYLSVLEATFVVSVVRPFHTNHATEIVAAPKVYAFDSGFVCAFRGWHELRQNDLGILWEHYVLNELRSCFPHIEPRYWRDKQKHEIDFVLPARRTGSAPLAIECKWSAAGFDADNLAIFRRLHPGGRNFVVAQDIAEPYTRKVKGMDIRYIGLGDIGKAVRP